MGSGKETRSEREWVARLSPYVAAAMLIFCVGFFGGILWVDMGAFLTNAATYGWAAAIGATFAAIAAVLAAFLPIAEKRRRDFMVGASEAISSRNTIVSAHSDLASALAQVAFQNVPAASIQGHLKNCVDKLNAIPIDSIRGYRWGLAQHLLTAKNELAFLGIGVTDHATWTSSCDVVFEALDAYLDELPAAGRALQAMIKQTDSR